MMLCDLLLTRAGLTAALGASQGARQANLTGFRFRPVAMTVLAPAGRLALRCCPSTR